MRRISRERTFEITSVVAFIERVEALRRDRAFPTTFRGQRSLRPLYPSLARPGGPAAGAAPERLVATERRLLDEFRRRLPKPVQTLPDYWETAVLGRHHGLPTRLLDWTELPIVALFFAVCGAGDDRVDDGDEDAGVLGTRGRRWFLHELPEAVGPTPWELREDGPVFFVPDFADERIFPQRSVLSVWKDPTIAFEEVTDAIWTLVIPRRFHRPIRRELDAIGITEELLFPGLDGTARYLRWKTAEETRDEEGGVERPRRDGGSGRAGT